jgi:hypothetical protein
MFRPMSLRHMQSDVKQRMRTPTPMKPTKIGGDEDGDEEVEAVADADADAAAEPVREGDVVEDMVTVGFVSEMALQLHHV